MNLVMHMYRRFRVTNRGDSFGFADEVVLVKSVPWVALNPGSWFRGNQAACWQNQ